MKESVQSGNSAGDKSPIQKPKRISEKALFAGHLRYVDAKSIRYIATELDLTARNVYYKLRQYREFKGMRQPAKRGFHCP